MTALGSDAALERLMAGNRRYVAAKLRHPHQTPDYRLALNEGQTPCAMILGCADSRVPPEVIFDQGLGDLFVVRVAGNIVDDVVLASLEYGAGHLGAPLLMVLGHSHCGAVAATLGDGELEGHLSRLAEAIRPAAIRAKGRPGDALDNAVRANVALTVEILNAAEPVLSERIKAGKLKVVGACYHLDTGVVERLS